MNVKAIDHPLLKHKVGLMREANISTIKFRELAAEVGALLTYEATRELEVETHAIESWAGPIEVEQLKGKKLTVVPILRAGLGMLDGVMQLIPSAKISVVGIYRDEETLQPIPYFEKLAPKIDERTALVVDPMLATGGTMVATIDMLKKKGCTKIVALVLVAAPEGVKLVNEAHPDVEIFTASLDDHLNDQGYILPGLGDAGDKIFGTK